MAQGKGWVDEMMRPVALRRRLKSCETALSKLRAGESVPKSDLLRLLGEYRDLLNVLWLWQHKRFDGGRPQNRNLTAKRGRVD